MHTTIEELRNLANAYVKEKILNDKQLIVKKHIAECDECYGKFCTVYLIQKELDSANFLPEDTFEEKESIANKMIMQISKIKDLVKKSKLELIVEKDFQNDERWNFQNIQYMAVARGSDGAEVYQNRISKESRILYEKGRLIIELDEEKYEGSRLHLLVTDGDKQERMNFTYDEDMELYRMEIDLKVYSEQVVLHIKESETI